MISIEDYPPVMNAAQLAKFLGVSKPTAYELMRRSDFPTIPLNDLAGSNIRVLRDDVVEWLKKQRNKGA